MTLTWKQGTKVIAIVDVPWAEALASPDRVATQGEHHDPRDRKRDRLVLQVDDKAELRDPNAALDAVYETEREVKDVGSMPVFMATLSMTTGSAPSGLATASSRERPTVRMGSRASRS